MYPKIGFSISAFKQLSMREIIEGGWIGLGPESGTCLWTARRTAGCLMWLWKAQRGAGWLMAKQLLHSYLYRCVSGHECQGEEGGSIDFQEERKKRTPFKLYLDKNIFTAGSKH